MEIQNLDNKIHETVETIQNMKTQREFYLSFSKDPQLFINKWLISQSRDLKMMTDVAGNPEHDSKVEAYEVCGSPRQFETKDWVFPTFLRRYSR